ncbi:MAG: selenoprotein glycine/betaine/sarcosine/D-proline reductase family [Dehalococcoidia bacterium]|nr:selenoprotein glycine/betaine/sarcosine/D-proline reductase family [Dehalococcoidia bacterium]
MRVVHYLNQFFGGVGGEEKAGTSLEVHSGALGPGRVLEQALGEGFQVVQTLVCGDNYAVENMDELSVRVLEMVRSAKADLFVAGPCFNAGRYGVAAGALCAAVQAELGIPAVTAMVPENPGVDLYRQELYIVDSGSNVAAMRDVVARMAHISLKLVRQEPIGRPSEEGYISRGILRDELVERTAAARMADMVLAKANEEPFESELPVTVFPPVPAPPPVRDMSRAIIAVVTDGGLVPLGNPDHIPLSAATIWGSYSVAGIDNLEGGNYEVAHRGYDTRHVLEDPNRLVPLDVLRELERAGVIGKLYEEFLSTSGLGNPLGNSRRLGREMAQKLKGVVDAVILTST